MSLTDSLTVLTCRQTLHRRDVPSPSPLACCAVCARLTSSLSVFGRSPIQQAASWEAPGRQCQWTWQHASQLEHYSKPSSSTSGFCVPTMGLLARVPPNARSSITPSYFRQGNQLHARMFALYTRRQDQPRTFGGILKLSPS